MASGHGGRRKGSGRPAGTGWKPAVAEMRVAAAERLSSLVGGSTDPLDIVLQIAADANQDTQTRLGACAIALPFLYPKLTASQVDARVTTVSVSAADILGRIEDRIGRIADASQGGRLIEVTPAPSEEEPQSD